MLSEERRRLIYKMIAQKKRVVVNEISERFHTSAVTIRNDLKTLEKQGIILRVHGGAILNDTLLTDIALTEKERLHRVEKMHIAQKAKEMINEGDVIILDSGSTTTFIARHVKFMKNIVIITNAVNIASELAASEVEVLVTGGILREKSFSLVGPIAEESIRTITADKFFLGVDGIDFEHGLTTPNLLEAKINRLMVKAASEVILVADSSKFGRKTLGVIAELNEIDRIITDSGITRKHLNRLRTMDLEVILV